MEALAAALECEHGNPEQTLDQMEKEILRLPAPERDGIRRKMICIVGQLSRMEVRMMTQHGPLGPAV